MIYLQNENEQKPLLQKLFRISDDFSLYIDNIQETTKKDKK